MPGHLEKNRKRFNVILKRPTTYTPGGYIAPVYGSKAQQMVAIDDSPPLNLAQFKKLLAPFYIMLELSIVPCSRK
jgi:hypothetical protein